MPASPIRIRIIPREPEPPRHDPREAFWIVAKRESESNQPVSSLEAKLCRDFGGELRRALLRELSEPLRALDTEVFPGSLRDIERWMFRFMDGPSSEREYRYQLPETFSRLLEQRQQLLRESPAFRNVQERLAAAAGVTFSTRIAGYSSLNLDLSVGSFRQLARTFENDFDSFLVFLEAFVPVAFAGVFGEDSADKLDFTVSVPTSAEREFHASTTNTQPPSIASPTPQTVLGSPGTTRERAEWLWRLANGSLLIPVLLALFVMYQGMKMLSDIRTEQYDALKPTLEHQLRLLEQDRQRLLRDVPQPTQSASTTQAAPGK